MFILFVLGLIIVIEGIGFISFLNFSHDLESTLDEDVDVCQITDVLDATVNAYNKPFYFLKRAIGLR